MEAGFLQYSTGLGVMVLKQGASFSLLPWYYTRSTVARLVVGLHPLYALYMTSVLELHVASTTS